MGHTLGDREAESQPLSRRVSAATKLLEYQPLLVRIDAGPGVPDFDAQIAAMSPASEQHAPAFGMAQRVAEKILQDAAQQMRIGLHPYARGHGFEAQTTLIRERGKFGSERRKHLVYRER